MCELHIFTNGNSALSFIIEVITVWMWSVCDCICLYTFTLYMLLLKCLKLPHVLLHSTIHSISVLKKTLSRTYKHGFCSFAFHIFFHLSQAQQIAFARSSKSLLWLSMSCAHNHVNRIYHVSFSTLLPVPSTPFFCIIYVSCSSISPYLSLSLHFNHSSTFLVYFVVVYALKFTFVTHVK